MASIVKRRGSSAVYAKHDPATALASLFRPVAPGRRPKGLDVSIEHNGCSLRFVCFEWLDMRDQSVLLAAISLAGLDGDWLSAESPSEGAKKLWLELEPEELALSDKARAFKTTRYALLQAAGMADTKQNYERLQKILFRLSNVGCGARSPAGFWSMHMMSFSASVDGSINIALNSRFAKAITGYHHIKISLKERFALKSDMARLVHAQVCARLRPGNSWTYNIDSVAENLWGEKSQEKKTMENRRKSVQNGFSELLNLPQWKGKIFDRGTQMKVEIFRPASFDTV